MSQEKTIFSKVIEREIPAQILFEDEVCIVILDAFPAVAGQTLVIPKLPTAYIFDLPTDIYQYLWEVSANIARALDRVFATERTCVVVEGFEVPHVHIKLYPMTKREDLGTALAHTAPLDPAVGASLRERIVAAL